MCVEPNWEKQFVSYIEMNRGDEKLTHLFSSNAKITSQLSEHKIEIWHP